MKTSQDSDLFIELTYGTVHSASSVRPFLQADLDNHLGFRSVYMFGKEAYNKIKETNSLRGLSKLPVYSDTLFVDFDDGSESIEQFKKVMTTSNIAWKMYFSGKKGFHFHIPIEPMWGRYVPYSQKQFILGLGFNTADTSIYKHTGLFRMPGTFHQDTGAEKSLVEEFEGNKLRIPYIEPELEFQVVEGATASLTAALTAGHHAIVDEPGPGGRHNTLLALCKHLLTAGAQHDTIRDLCTLVHNTWESGYEEPEIHIEEALNRAVKWQAFGD